MSQDVNKYGQPVGRSLPDWQPRPFPPHTILKGRYCWLEPIDDRHAESLFAAYHQAPDARDWTYIPLDRPDNPGDCQAYVASLKSSVDPQHYAIVDPLSGKALGTLALMRISPAVGSVEVGFVVYSPLLQKSTAATEAQFLLMQYAFETLGYRRYEWKCDSLNAPSKAAALRLGFTFEGIFRQAVVYKGRNRDTAWFSIIDSEWPGLAQVYRQWLSPDNFDASGKQHQRLQDFMRRDVAAE
ncbi:GNAT family N-acetyltransferase [Methylobacillus arboreus]|uniref:GNAT family N-acetyltransferase n=1 Tax=Methylobacillus arboreus TaxID=755170 RepID=UPI001E59FD59|nr:GNAT family protein [Methylobacillus arboreus]MCB5189937.1 GNAT family N-acetyltransferase [Methylobacillus arboreus]